jgi:hypothetical protein
LRWARAALSHSAVHGLSVSHLGALIAELAPAWASLREGRLHQRRGAVRRRAAGAGRKAVLVFTDQVLATLAYLRLGLPQRVLAAFLSVSQATISRAVAALRTLLAARGFANPTGGPRLRTLADVMAYATATGFDLCMDGTDIAVRRPKAGRPGRRAFVSGKHRRNTIKTTAICDQARRLLWVGATRPGRMHDQTAMKTEGIDDLLRAHPGVRIWADDGYRGLSRDHPGQVITKHREAPDTAEPEIQQHIRDIRKLHCQQRIPIEQSIAELKTWRVVHHWRGPRHHLPEMITAVAGLLSDRTAMR